MSTVRRVTVENGLIVVTTKDGKVERQPMTNVVRMAIEP
jgi:phage terminase small subunit